MGGLVLGIIQNHIFWLILLKMIVVHPWIPPETGNKKALSSCCAKRIIFHTATPEKYCSVFRGIGSDIAAIIAKKWNSKFVIFNVFF